MEGMLKSAPTTQQPVEIKHDSETSSVGSMTQSIHPEFYGFFNVDPLSSESSQLKTVADWAMKDSTPGMALKKLKDLEIKLGTPTPGDTRLSKLYNYIRLTSKLDMKESELNETISNVNKKHQAMMKELVDTHESKIDKIDAELRKARLEYNKAKNAYKKMASENAGKIRNQYARQLSELKAMRDAYKGGK